MLFFLNSALEYLDMDENKKSPEFGIYGSSAISVAGLRGYPGIINVQLENWRAAVRAHSSLTDDSAPDVCLTVILSIGAALTNLFGAAHSGDLPQLMGFVDREFKKKSWDLKSENPTLYSSLNELANLYNSTSKHFGPGKIESVVALSKSKTDEFMRTTAHVWMWYVGKNLLNGTPPEQLVEFKDYL